MGCQHFSRSAVEAESDAQKLFRLLALQREIGVSRIADVTGLDVVGVPVVSVIRPLARSLSVAQGKGLTQIAAKISGMMEAMELHHAEFCCPRPISFCLADPPAMPVVDVDLLPRYMGRKLDPGTAIPWVKAIDLHTFRAVWVPYRAVTMDRRPTSDPAATIFIGGATGLAAGFSIEQAVNHALCEIIERDAYTLWKAAVRAGIPPIRIDLTTISDQSCVSMIERFQRVSLQVIVWMMPSDLGVPAFLAEVIDPGTPPRTLCTYSHGTGCGIDPAIALRKAMLEAAQTRLTYISGARDDLLPADFGTRFDALVAHRRTFLQSADDATEMPVLAPVNAGSIAAENSHLLQRIEMAGYQALAVNLTAHHEPVHVVKVIIPGFEDDIGVNRYEPGIRVLCKRLSCRFERLPWVA